eukprot:6210774-Pleurochrysis_carterae.AAC.1
MKEQWQCTFQRQNTEHELNSQAANSLLCLRVPPQHSRIKCYAASGLQAAHNRAVHHVLQVAGCVCAGLSAAVPTEVVRAALAYSKAVKRAHYQNRVP